MFKVDLEDRGLSLERLPETSTEVMEIAGLFEKSGSKAEVRLGDAATKESLLATDLNRFRFLHFATHGVAPTVGKLREPALVFSYRGSQIQQALLPVSEIAHLKMNSEMVTLSACNPGSGHISRAEGVMNLGRAFSLAGARNVTVSLWSVSDDSTSKLMQEFYREMQSGKTKSEALAGARAMLRRDSRYSDPYYWAPFILIGE